MKNLYKKGKKIHPSPPSTPAATYDYYLSLLPATILTLTDALSPEDKQVLAYLISCSAATNYSNTLKKDGGDHGGGGEHGPSFECNCFRCYMSFWAKWDTSPNRQVIHEIIEAYEEGLFWKKMMRKTSSTKNKKKNYKEKREEKTLVLQEAEEEKGELESTEPPSYSENDAPEEQGTVRKVVSFIGEKIWGVWNRD